LKALKAHHDRYLETPRQDPDHAELAYATEQKPGEIVGYSASARRSTGPRPATSTRVRRAESEPF
jgi:hypothetical protein